MGSIKIVNVKTKEACEAENYAIMCIICILCLDSPTCFKPLRGMVTVTVGSSVFEGVSALVEMAFSTDVETTIGNAAFGGSALLGLLFSGASFDFWHVSVFSSASNEISFPTLESAGFLEAPFLPLLLEAESDKEAFAEWLESKPLAGIGLCSLVAGLSVEFGRFSDGRSFLARNGATLGLMLLDGVGLTSLMALVVPLSPFEMEALFFSMASESLVVSESRRRNLSIADVTGFRVVDGTSTETRRMNNGTVTKRRVFVFREHAKQQSKQV